MAKITYAHGGDHAVVAFTGELDWDAVRELVDVVELLIQEYFYSTVELLVTSPGGNVRAFEHYLGRRAVWRAHGVRVRTRVFSEAASAAALLVSLGDERIADPGATLLYHCTHMSPEGVNAEATAAISSVLREMDEGFIARLAARGLECRAEVAHGAERADRELLRQLWPGLGSGGSGGGDAPAKVRKRARAVGRYVDQAVRGGDGDALARLYRRLFETECRLSARLARALARVGAVACQRTAPVRVVRAALKPCIAPRPGPNECLAGKPRVVAKLHRPWPGGGGLPAWAISSPLLFTILTVTRGIEAREARWGEIDLVGRMWRIPGSRMKMGEDHDQPLSEAALEVLERARVFANESGLVFLSRNKPRQPLSNVSFMNLLKRLGYADRATAHGFRATFRTWASERTKASARVKKLSTAHKPGDKMEDAYDRSLVLDPRRELMERSGCFVTDRPYVCGG